MSLRTSSFSYAEVTTVQVPVCEIDRWGNSTVTYEPMQLVSYSVTFPTSEHGHTHYIICPHLPNKD